MQLRHVSTNLRQGLRRNLSMHAAVVLTLFVTLSLTSDQGIVTITAYTDCGLGTVLGSGSTFSFTVNAGQSIKVKSTNAMGGQFNDGVGAGVDVP